MSPVAVFHGVGNRFSAAHNPARSHYFIPLSRSRLYGARCDAQVTRRGPTNEYICSTKRAAATRPNRFLCCTRVTTDDDSTTCLRAENAVSRSMKLSPIVDAPLSHESTSPTFRVDRTSYLSRRLCSIQRFAVTAAFLVGKTCGSWRNSWKRFDLYRYWIRKIFQRSPCEVSTSTRLFTLRDILYGFYGA